MATTTVPVAAAKNSRRPRFAPDPKLIGNDEGNDRLLKHDQKAAREAIDEQADQ